MKLLIIGGSGHVSGALARAAVARGDAVWAVTRGKRPLPEGVRSIVADRKDSEAMAAAFAAFGLEWDLVVDCICFDLPDIRQDIALFRERTRQFVLVSTDFVYDPARRSFPQPATTCAYVSGGDGSLEYGRKKRLCELELIESDTGAMAWAIVRPTHIYGAPSELGCLPLHGRDPRLIARLRSGETIHLVGGGHFLQQPILATDLADLVLSMAGNERAFAGIFNAAGPDVIESRRYYEIVAETLGVRPNIVETPVDAYLAEHPGQAPFLCHRFYDLAPLRSAGLSVPATPLVDGLRRHVETLLTQSLTDPAAL
jgi:nucleoside-diphosphate-sugar epimerase